MQVQPIIYVSQMQRSIEWYSLLLDTSPELVSDHWTTFGVGGAIVALHASDDANAEGSVALSLVAPTPLENTAARLGADATIVDHPFGRSFIATDPDGTRIQVNEHHHP